MQYITPLSIQDKDEQIVKTGLSLTKKQRVKLRKALNEECEYKLKPELLDKLIDLGEPIWLKRGESILKRDEIDDNLYILVDGIMRIWFPDGDTIKTYAFGLPGSIAQSFHCVTKGITCRENYEACAKSLLIKITREDYNKLIESDIRYMYWHIKLLEEQLFLYERRRTSSTGNAREKYNEFIHRRPEVMQKVPLKFIASYLGITPEYLSNLRKQLD